MKYIITVIRILFLALFIFLILKGKMMLWLALFGVSLIVALVFGRVYCGYICPMNTVMIPVEGLSKKLRLQKDQSPKWLRSGIFPWFALAGSIIFMVLTQKLLDLRIPILMIWLAVSVLVTLRYKPSVFHNLICPFGALLKVFGRSPIFSEKVNKQGCIGCKLCTKVCPSNAIEVKKEDKKSEIKTSLCLQCTNCQQVCPKNTIHYSKQR